MRAAVGYVGTLACGFAVAYLIQTPLTHGQIAILLLFGGLAAGYSWRPWGSNR